MSIAEFIRENVLRQRLKQAGALAVYDADKRYRELCFDLAAEKVRVIDASESSIESREAALLALREVGQAPKNGQGTPLEGVLIYVPAKGPAIRSTQGAGRLGAGGPRLPPRHLGPERVREKCKTDKSLAIAHGLEDLYVEPEAATKKTRGRRKTGAGE